MRLLPAPFSTCWWRPWPVLLHPRSPSSSACLGLVDARQSVDRGPPSRRLRMAIRSKLSHLCVAAVVCLLDCRRFLVAGSRLGRQQRTTLSYPFPSVRFCPSGHLCKLPFLWWFGLASERRDGVVSGGCQPLHPGGALRLETHCWRRARARCSAAAKRSLRLYLFSSLGEGTRTIIIYVHTAHTLRTASCSLRQKTASDLPAQNRSTWRPRCARVCVEPLYQPLTVSYGVADVILMARGRQG